MGPSEVDMTPKRMLTRALLLVVAQPSLSIPYVMMRQASPLLYPASYLSSSHQTLYTGMFSPWSSFYFPSVATQRNTAPAAQQAPATTRQLEANTATDDDSSCYEDGSDRLLKGFRKDDKQSMTPEVCKKICFEDNNFQYAGVQYRYECFCGNTSPPASKLLAKSECNLPCSGDSSKICGGVSKMNVYKINGKASTEPTGELALALETDTATDDEEPVTKDNLVATLPSWGEYFEVSLQIWVESHKPGVSELLRFTSTDKDCCSVGDRIPAIFVHSDGYIHVTSQVGTNGNYYKNFNIKLKTWIKVDIKQYPDGNGKAIYEVIVDGKSAVKAENSEPTIYENVKVWAAQGKHFATSNAKIKEFEYQQKTSTEQTGELTLGCGTWTIGQYGCYKHFVEEKSWQAAREQCREDGRSQGVSDADLAYFDDATERDDVIEDLGISTSAESLWLNGKLGRSGFVVMKDSKWVPSEIANTEWIGGSTPTFDLNAERNLYIRTQDKKLGADPGGFTSKEFICEFKKRVCKDSTWMFDIDNQRCLKVFSEEKTYKNAKDDCENESSDSTLASLVPSIGTKLEDLTKTHLGTWVLESASKDATGSIQFIAPNRGSDTGSAPVTDSLAHWTIDPSYELTTDFKHLSINSFGLLVPVFDMDNAKARFICQHTPESFSGTPLEFDVAARKPLARSGLSFHTNV